MAEFFNVLPPDEARALLLSHLTRPVEAEVMATIPSNSEPMMFSAR